MGIDDVIAAVVLSLIMLRRIEVRTARVDQNPHLDPAALESWRKALLAAYDVGAAICALKVLLTLGWRWAVGHFGIGQPMFSAVPAVIFVVWVIVLVSVWRRVSEARSQQERLGIVVGARS